MLTYLKHAFLFRWNLLAFLGASAFAVLSGQPDALLPIVAGAELAYLAGLTSMPKFRTAIDAKVAAEERGAPVRKTDVSTQQSLQRMVDSLPTTSLKRFMALRQRCVDMRDIATGVQGRAQGGRTDGDVLRTPALDRLLFLFLRLLMSQAGLDRFLRSTNEEDLGKRLADVKRQLVAAEEQKDERLVKSLQDSLSDAQLRLDNYKKAEKDATFVAVELDRIETKIQALTEMGVSHQDAEYMSTQVTAAADSMAQTEDAVKSLQSLTGLADQMAEPPAILEANLDRQTIRTR